MDTQEFALDEPNYSGTTNWHYGEIDDLFTKIKYLAIEGSVYVTRFKDHNPVLDLGLLGKIRQIETVIKGIENCLDTENFDEHPLDDCRSRLEEYQDRELAEEGRSSSPHEQSLNARTREDSDTNTNGHRNSKAKKKLRFLMIQQKTCRQRLTIGFSYQAT